MQTNNSQFLRNVLRFDALTCLLSGAASIGLGSVLAGPLGLSSALLRGSGAALLLVAAFIMFAAKNTPALRWPVWVVVLGNAAWALDSVLLLISDFQQPTLLGTSYVITQAVAVAVLAELEYVGLRKTAPTAAAAISG
ncbi:MAG: hypothetical protein ABW321_16495 [Polyangiales bacterium]